MSDETGTGGEGQAAVETQEAAAIAARIEALLLTAGRPVGVKAIVEALNGAGVAADAAQVEAAIDELNKELDASGRAARVEKVAGGYRVMVRGEHAPVLAAVRQQQIQGRLSRAAIETLAIVAYKQPITRADLESIRGVACGEVLRSLMERRLVTIQGRAEEPGRPILYGTTKEFLDQFGLASIKDLPPVDQGAIA